MNWKKRLLKKCGACIILDKDVCKDIFGTALKIRNPGFNVVQLRAKNAAEKTLLGDASRLKSLFGRSRNIFIVNDHVDIAHLVDADGVHLGQEDLPIEAARKILGRDKIIGVSCHSLQEALKAQKNGADYIGIGPVFKTPVKPKDKPVGLGLLKSVKQKIKIPVFAIGGINRGNLNKILSAGVSRVAICRDVCLAKNAVFSIKGIKKILNDAN